MGLWRRLTFRKDSLDVDLLRNGISFDGSSIPGWKPVENSDMLLRPDLDRIYNDPFSARKTAIIICNVIDTDTNEEYTRCPRSILAKAVHYMKNDMGYNEAYFGPEPEFFIFDNMRHHTSQVESFAVIDGYSNNTKVCDTRDYTSGRYGGHSTSCKQNYMTAAPANSHQDILDCICDSMESLGLEPSISHAEVAIAQSEIGIKHNTPVNIADNVLLYKHSVLNTVASYGKTATFMPKPICGDNGSGMHIHQSLWKDGKNQFFDEHHGLSLVAKHYIGGILKHIKSINAFSNPTVNSYKRLVPGFEAPVYAAYSNKNRSVAIRIPYSTSADAKRIEARFPDPSANPYLCMSVLLMAGLDGIKNEIDPGEEKNNNMDLISDNNIEKVALSLDEALDALECNHSFLTSSDVMNEGMIYEYIKLKRMEINEIKEQISPMEYKMYYSA